MAFVSIHIADGNNLHALVVEERREISGSFGAINLGTPWLGRQLELLARYGRAHNNVRRRSGSSIVAIIHNPAFPSPHGSFGNRDHSGPRISRIPSALREVPGI